MRAHLLYIALLLAIPMRIVNAQQLAPVPKNASAAGYYTLGRRPDGILTERGKTGQPAPVSVVPFLSVSGVRSTTATSMPMSVYLTGSRSGQFDLDPADTTTPDDSVMTLVSASGARYKRKYDGFINSQAFGATGRGNSVSDTVAMKAERDALQKAINYAIKSANPAANGSTNPNRFRPATAYIPAGTYYIWGSIKIPGAVHITGDGGLSYGGTLIFQVKDHVPIFELAADTDGGSNCVQIENMRLRGGTPAGASASTISVPATMVFGAHSLHLRDVWFQNWEKNAIDIQGNADDPQIVNCVFDGTQGGPAISLGSAGRISANVSITGNTFYDCKNGVLDIINAKNVVVSNNRAYATTYVPPYFINANLSGSQPLVGLTVTGNSINDHGPILQTKSGGYTITGNTYTNARNSVLVLDGGGLITGGTITGNHITGTFATTVTSNGDLVYGAPIRAYATGVTGMVVQSNTIIGQPGSLMPGFFPDSRTAGNTLDFSTATGFSLPSIVANPFANLTSYRALTDVQSYSSSTASWNMSVYNQVLAPGVLLAGHVYLVTVRYVQTGFTETTQSYIVPVANTTGSGVAGADLVGTVNEYNNGTTYYIKLRYKPGTPTPGLEATVSTTGLSGNATITISPLR